MKQTITLVGTSHVSPDSIKKLAKLIKNKSCVCVELDPVRYYALTNKEIKKPPGLFAKLLHHIQQKLGRSTGVLPGEDMMAALREAQKVGVPAYLIDQDIRVTLGRLRRVPLLEKLSLLVPLLVAPKSFDVSKVPSQRLVTTSLREMRRRAPKMYEVLVTERNEHMASLVVRIALHHKRVLVVVGAAHTKGLAKLLKARGLRVNVV